MTRIAVDAMGSDAYPVPDIAGAVMAAREFGIEVLLVGNEPEIGPLLEAEKPGNLRSQHCARTRNPEHG